MGVRTRRAHKHSKTYVVAFGLAGVVGFAALLCVALSLSLGAIVTTWLEDLPDYTSADAYLVSEPTIVYDANGNEIASYYLQNRRSVELSEVSEYVINGTIATEDSRFYTHSGIDIMGILRAAVGQVTGNSDAGGGSTITQQLVRNTVLSDEQFEYSLKRKVREAYIAIQMEKAYTKDQILNMYLNTIYYGESCYGIEAAAITYFNKNACDLTLAEAATLVAIPNSPSYYDPFINPENCKTRRNLVLNSMLEAGYITQEECDAAKAEEIVLNRGKLSNAQGTYPYFTDYIRSLLLQDFSSDLVYQGGLQVYTTINPTIQAAAEEAVNTRIEMANNDEISGALVCIDNSNGYVVAMVGGQNYGYDEELGQSSLNLATNARQAGSSFKMFTLVAALEAGMNPTVKINCNSPIQITTDWEVKNYEDSQYGTRTLTEATRMSANTAFAQLIEVLGVDSVIEVAHTMGIDSDLERILSITLGASPVTPLEMCEAYSTLATGGVHRESCAIIRIEDRNGNIVYQHEDDPEQALSTAIAAQTTEILEGVVGAAYTGRYVGYIYNANQPIAGKTGTSDDSENLWFCGYSPQYTAVVWVGNLTNNQRVYYQGYIATTGNTAQPIWANFMNSILAGLEREEFPTATSEDLAAYQANLKDNSTWDFIGTSQSTNENIYWYDSVQDTTEVYTGGGDEGGDEEPDEGEESSGGESEGSAPSSSGESSGGSSGGESSGGSSSGESSGGSSSGESSGGSSSGESSGGSSGGESSGGSSSGESSGGSSGGESSGGSSSGESSGGSSSGESSGGSSGGESSGGSSGGESSGGDEGSVTSANSEGDGTSEE